MYFHDFSVFRWCGNGPVLFLHRPISPCFAWQHGQSRRRGNRSDDTALLKHDPRVHVSFGGFKRTATRTGKPLLKIWGWSITISPHQVKTFCKRVKPRSVLLSCVAGTQVLDRSWQSLKTFLPPKLSAKLKVDGDSALNPAVKQQLFMWKWRASLGPCTPKQFLDALESLL